VSDDLAGWKRFSFRPAKYATEAEHVADAISILEDAGRRPLPQNCTGQEVASARLREIADLYERDGRPGPRGLNCWGWKEIAQQLRAVAKEIATTSPSAEAPPC
jgi:hypothetical protein